MANSNCITQDQFNPDGVQYGDYAIDFVSSKEQQEKLKQKMNKFDNDQNYSAVYEYLKSIAPKSDYHNNISAYTQKETAIRNWLTVAASTNGQRGDV